MLYIVTPALSARALTPRLLEDLAVNIVQEISSGLIHAVEDFVEKDLDVEGELPRVLATEAGSGYQFISKYYGFPRSWRAPNNYISGYRTIS